MLTRRNNSRQNCRSLPSRFSEIHGRHVGTRTPDLYRVNFEVTTLKPFPYLAFPHFPAIENTPKRPSFDGELMASSPPRSTRAPSLHDCWCNGNIMTALQG